MSTFTEPTAHREPSEPPESPARTAPPAHARRDGARPSFDQLAPKVVRALISMGQAAAEGLDHRLAELVKIRASQLNHCAFCLQMHIADARAAGESEERVHLLSAWEEAAGHYTERERAALALTEAITLLTDGFVPDAVYERAAAHFDQAELVSLIGVIANINTWNRINVAYRTAPVGPS